MQEVKQYREFASECRRLAGKAKTSDKAVLLEIAEAWEKQANIAEAAILKNADGKPDGHDAAP